MPCIESAAGDGTHRMAGIPPPGEGRFVQNSESDARQSSARRMLKACSPHPDESSKWAAGRLVLPQSDSPHRKGRSREWRPGGPRQRAASHAKSASVT